MTDLAALARTWAVVPWRGRSGKRRLSGLLDDNERLRLVSALLADVLDALLAVSEIERVSIVAPLGADADLADEYRAATADPRVVWLPERGVPAHADEQAGASGESFGPVGLNAALRRAQAVAEAEGVGRLAIVPADLPLLSADDVSALLSWRGATATDRQNGSGGIARRVAIAPDATETGTNALLIEPPAALAPSFGDDSFRAHLTQAEQRGLVSQVVRRPGLAFDLDIPADLARLIASGAQGRAAMLVRDLRLAERLAVLAPCG